MTNPDDLRCAWKKAQSRINAFWKAWRQDYLSLLHARAKWKSPEKNIAIDELVIITDETTHRSQWRLARVIAADASNGLVRKVSLRRADGKVIVKDRTKIVRLELDQTPSS